MRRTLSLGSIIIIFSFALLMSVGLVANGHVRNNRNYISVEEAYYANNQDSEIRLILQGYKCDLVIGEKADGTYLYEYILKNEIGWTVNQKIDAERIVSEFDGNIAVTVYRYLDDYFITVFNAKGGLFEITDSIETKFSFLSQLKEYDQKEYYLACAHLEEYSKQYWLEVDGEKRQFSNE